MKSKSIEKIPFGSYCYTVVEMKPNEFDGVDLREYGKSLREHPYHGLSKAVLCPYWRGTNYGMTNQRKTIAKKFSAACTRI